MLFTNLGSTGIRISRIAFGGGPVPEVMTQDKRPQQLELVRQALDAGINWFDTAPTYGQGKSERNLGATLAQLGASNDVHVATKVRIMPDQLEELTAVVKRTVANSLQQLQVKQITLLQIHNSLTAKRGDEPTSLTPADILDSGGMLEIFRQLREEGTVRHLGITAIGQASALHEVIGSGQFDTIQVPYNLMNSSAGQDVDAPFNESNYGNVIAECERLGMGVFAIRVFAGGALAGRPPSAHTYTTKFFPLELYARDQQRAKRLTKLLDERMGLREAAVRFALSHPSVSSAIIGFGEPKHVDDAFDMAGRGPLPEDLLERLRQLDYLEL